MAQFYKGYIFSGTAMKRQVPAIVFLILFGCTNVSPPTLQASELNASILEKIVDEEKCDAITCGENEACSEGKCSCTEDFKSCDGRCVVKTACCSDTECGQEKFCGDDAKCHFSKRTCEFNEIWTVEKESCVCSENSRWCDAQRRCIPSNHCCVVDDCTGQRTADVCVKTQYAPQVCIKDPLAHCKSIIEGQNGLFRIENNFFRVAVDDVIENKVLVRLNDVAKELMVQEDFFVNESIILFVDSVKALGGFCERSRDN